MREKPARGARDRVAPPECRFRPACSHRKDTDMHGHELSRRRFLRTATVFGASAAFLRSRDLPAGVPEAAGPDEGRSVVAVTNGASRRQNICDALASIEDRIRGAKLPDVTKRYRMHDDIERELRWMGPIKEVPEKLG